MFRYYFTGAGKVQPNANNRIRKSPDYEGNQATGSKRHIPQASGQQSVGKVLRGSLNLEPNRLAN